MLKMRVIPCLDVKDGRVVKGVNFVDLLRRAPQDEGRKINRLHAEVLALASLEACATHEGQGC